MVAHFDPSLPITIETDASGFAIGAVLSQKREVLVDDAMTSSWHPVAFYPRKMIDAETRNETQTLLPTLQKKLQISNIGNFDKKDYASRGALDALDARWRDKASEVSRKRDTVSQVLSVIHWGNTHMAPGSFQHHDYLASYECWIDEEAAYPEWRDSEQLNLMPSYRRYRACFAPVTSHEQVRRRRELETTAKRSCRINSIKGSSERVRDASLRRNR